MVLGNLIQLQLVLNLVGLHGGADVLLVGEDEKTGVLHFTVGNDAGQLAASLLDTVAVAGVDDEDETLGACILNDVSGRLNGRAD